MAYYFDEMGQYVEYETDEERKRRENFNNTAVQTQEIKTYGDGTVEKITKEEMPGDYAPAIQPVAVQPVQQMPVQQPVAPVAPTPETYQRMIQAESGGRDFAQSGAPLTSPKGAMFAAQVMPATAASPGFGVRPAEAQTPEEYNRVGREYYDAMLKKYGGNEQAAAAAYNAGPGRVDRNMQANAGQLNVSQLPQETQQYLQKVLPQQAAPAMAQAQPAQAPAAPEPVSPYSLATGQTGLGIQTGQAPATEPAKQYIDNYQSVQDDPLKLLALRSDENAPKFIRDRAAEQAYALMNKEVQTAAATKQAQALAQAAASGDRKASNTIARELQGQEGSYLKMILLGFISPTLAGEEAVKLGYGNKWTTTTDADGKAALIQVNAKGLPLKGYAQDGTEIATDDLVKYAAGGAAAKGVTQGQEVYKDPTGKVKGGFVLETRPNRFPVYREVGTGRPATPEESAALSKVGVAGTLEQQSAAQQQKLGINLIYEPAIAAASKGAATLAEFNAMRGTNFAIAGRDSLGMPLLVDQQSGQLLVKPPAAAGTAPAAGVPQSAAQAAAQGGRITPLPTTVAPAAPPTGMSPVDIQQGEAFTKGQQEQFIKYVAEEVQPKAEVSSQISRIRKDQIQGPDGILNNAELAGVLQGQGGKGSEAANIMRDLITGNFKDEADLSRRVASLSLNQRQKDVLYRQIGLNLQVAPLTLKQNAGAGAVSDAEQKANREANVDITRQPLYSGLSLLTRDQFQKDLAVAKNDLRSSRPDIRSTDQLNKAWSDEKKKAETAYDGIYRARAQYIAKYNADGTNTRAVVDAFKYYPVPEWTGSGWDYKTEYAKKAARPSLDSFNR